MPIEVILKPKQRYTYTSTLILKYLVSSLQFDIEHGSPIFVKNVREKGVLLVTEGLS